MSPRNKLDRSSLLRVLPQALGAGAAAVGGLMLAGWILDIDAVKTMLFVLASMVVFSVLTVFFAAALNRLNMERSHDRRRAEEAVRTSEGRFRAIVEQSIAGLYVIQEDRFVYVNPKMEEIFGCSAGDLSSRPVFDWIVPEEREIARENIRKRIEENVQSVRYHLRMRRLDGRVIHVEAHGARAEHNGKPAILGVLLDVTERDHAEAALRESEERFRAMAERLRMLHQIDRAMIAGEKPEAIAEAALPLVRELVGVGRAVVNLFDLANREVEWLAAAGRRRVHVGPGVRYSIEFMGDVEALRRGEHQWIDVHTMPPGPEVDALLASGVDSYVVVPMIVESELIGALSFGGAAEPISPEQIGIAEEAARQFAIALSQARLHERVKRQAQELEIRVRDRTRQLEEAHAELRQANNELLALTDELKASNKELEAFCYSVSHDLRAPLRGIDGFSRILLDEFGPQLPAEAQDHLREVRDSAREMGRLIDDLLAFSRLGRQAMRTQVVHPNTLVRECLEPLRAEAEKEGRKVEIVEHDLEPCRGDAALLKQVWVNLLSNALKYTRRKDVARIEIASRKGGDREGEVTYSVRDNGVGFDMRYAHKLFGVFQRLHRAEDYEGTGVGLATVQRIVHRHGGRVWGEGRPGEGATFYFTLQGGGT